MPRRSATRLGARHEHALSVDQAGGLTLGGTRNGTIVHWPNGFTDKGKTRNQFHHVIDVAKTILDAAGLPKPTLVNATAQAPLEG
jgi:arylsulfatase A-like enzyme